MQTRIPSVEHIAAVLRRGCLNELRFPRLCTARTCRRHGRCRETGDCDPRCIASLHEIDRRRFEELYERVLQILQGCVTPRPSPDPARCDLEEEAIIVIFDCLDELPFFREPFFRWHDIYAAPPVPAAPPAPPRPPVDAGALAREMKAELELLDIKSELRGWRG